jgi:hypothetical protein
MNIRRKQKKALMKSNLSIDIDKNIIKEIIIESYKEIEDQRKKRHTPTEFLKLPISMIFGLLKIILGFLSITFFIVPFFLIYTEGWSFSNVLAGVVSISIALLCGLFALVCHRTDKELEKETDKYYIVAYFSAIVSLVALIVALIGLLKVI